LAIVFSLIDLRKFGQAVQQADLRFLVAGLLSEFLWLAVRSFVWRTLLQNKASYKDTFISINEGYLLNNILPFRLGELGRAFLLGRKAHLDFWQVLPTILIERLLDLAIAAGLLLSTLPFVIGVAWAKQAAIITGIAVLVGLVVIYIMARNRQRVVGWVDRLGEHWALVKKLAGQRVSAFFDGLEILTDGKLFLRALLWVALNWIVSFLQYYLFLRAFFPDPHPLWVLFALGVGSMGIAAPSSPGAIGVFEASIVVALLVFKLDASPATAFALTVHFSAYIITGLIGGYGLYKDGESLSSLYTRLGRMKSEGEPPAQDG
jgi:uncharacterized protein (TIRG00374 family)